MGGMPEDVVGGLGVGRVEYLVHSGGGHDILFGIVLLLFQHNNYLVVALQLFLMLCADCY